MNDTVHVAVGVVLDTGGKVLISRRADDAHQGGLWEFPGGKVEPGESVEQALAREFREELSLHIKAATPLTRIEHDYGDKCVLLDVWQVTDFSGDAVGLEGQAVRWVLASELEEYAFPAANQPILEQLRTICCS